MSKTTVEKKHPSNGVMTTFSVVERRIHSPHKIQFYVDYGSSSGGPWIKVGVNETEFGVGYLPKTNPTVTHRQAVTLAAV
jgi:hypothetical protein